MLLFLVIPYLVVAAQPCMEWILIKKTFDESSFIMTFLNIKAPFLILYFSYYTLMTFLMMLSVILLSILMIWSLATARIEFWTQIWSTWQCGLGKWKWLFYRYYFYRCSSKLIELVPLPYYQGRSTCYSDRLDNFSVTIPDVTRMSMSTVSLPMECFPLTYDLSSFKSRINRRLLTVGSF